MAPRTLILILLLGSLNAGWAGVTGTLSGRITDQETAQPLPGVNLILKETRLGTTTGPDGYYLLNNIPAGRYEVTASMMGYRSVTKRSVVILMDLRTIINFELPPTVLDMEEVVITAEAPLIRRDITATTHFVSSYEIERLPLMSFQEIVDIQPGVAAGHIRGGRRAEVVYLVDGLPIQEAIEGDVGSELPNSSIIDMTVQTGGFNAEYGNAMSGVVNIVTKDGGKLFGGMAEFSGVHFSRRPNPFDDRPWDTDYIAEINLGGPVGGEWMRGFLSADLRAPNTRWRREQFGNRMLIFNTQTSYNANLNGKLTCFPSDHFRLSLQGLLSFWDWTEYDHKWKYNLQGLPPRSKNSYRVSLSGTHTLSPRTFYELRLSQYNVLKSIYGESSFEQAPVHYADREDDPGTEDPTSWVIAGDMPWWLDHQEIHNIGKIDVVSQITPHHQIKSGLEVTFYDLYKKNVQRRELASYDPTNFPMYLTYDTEYHYYPWRGSAYLQDKIEYEGMVANVGFRYDRFDPRGERPALEKSIDELGESTWIVRNDETVPASVKHQISPRLGLALPISPRDELHVNYGYFFQMPLFDYLYTNSNLNPGEGFSPLGDPDLKPAWTVAYEASYKRQLSEDILLDVTIFNKDVTNLVDSNTFLEERSGALTVAGYTRCVNMEQVNIHGAEIFLKRREGKFLTGKISYTYMIAKGTGSERTEKFNWLTRETMVPIREYYLSWDQRHTLVVNIDLRKEHRWGLNILWRWNSPLPYTEYRGIATRPNNARMEPTTTLDIRFNKDFIFWGFRTFLFMESLNTFDSENLLWVDARGMPGGKLGDPGAWDQRQRYRIGLGMKY